jgi:bifunctional DNA-binding transcriptional regulator/antitoxin component of YhaV-PrlF toxin-antitoxin module
MEHTEFTEGMMIFTGLQRDRRDVFKRLQKEGRVVIPKNVRVHFIEKIGQSLTPYEGCVMAKRKTTVELLRDMETDSLIVRSREEIGERVLQILENPTLLKELSRQVKNIMGFYRDPGRGITAVYLFLSVTDMWGLYILHPFLPPPHSYQDEIVYIP